MQGDDADEKGVFQIAEKGVQGIFAYRDALRAQGIVEFLHAERGCRIRQKVALQRTERQRVGDAVALDDIAQDGDVHVGAQQVDAIARRHALRFRETADGQVLPQPAIHLRARAFGQASRASPVPPRCDAGPLGS